MTLKVSLFCCLLGLFPVLAAAQLSAPPYDVVPIASVVYHETMHAYVYTTKVKLGTPASLPVVYVPGEGRKDNSFYVKLNQLVQQGMMPPVRIVGIELRTDLPDQKSGTDNYLDPKGLADRNNQAEALYYAFIVGEVIPAIEKRYACTPNKTLCTDGAGSFAAFVLKNYAETFTTYLSLSPFALYDPKTNLRYVKGVTPPSGTKKVSWVEELTPDEHALKTGRPGWVGDQQ